MTSSTTSRRRGDALEDLVELLERLEPGIGKEALRGVLLATARSLHARTMLLRLLSADPQLLTSGSAVATRPVSRLALALIDAGAAGITAPRCARCHGAILLAKRTPEGGICDACYNRARTASCVGCGRHRRIAGRDPDGSPVCSSCRARDPANHSACSRCGRMAPVNTRTPAGQPLCTTCSTSPPGRCDGCGQIAAIYSRKWGRALCQRCYRQPKRACGRCGRVRRIAVRARDGQPDLCPNCHWAPTGLCTRCGRHGMGFGVRAGALICLHCSAADRFDELITTADGAPAPGLLALRNAFLKAEQPRSIHTWLDRSPGRHILTELAAGTLELTHEALDARPQTPAVIHLRALLIASGALPERDPELARLQRAITTITVTLEHREDRRLLHAYATWRVLHRLRRYPVGSVTPLAAAGAQARLAHTARFLAWLHQQGHSLTDATQLELDMWLADHRQARAILSPFLRWAAQRGIAATLTLPAPTVGWSPTAAPADARWALARRLLHDDELDAGDRSAGLLVVLYAQPVARIARLRRSDITDHDGELSLLLGTEPVLMPSPLDELLRRLPHRRQTGPSGTAPAASQWLFPGRQAGQHQHPEHLRRRLKTIGIDCRANRNAALLQLAAEIPAAVLADTLGITPSTAVRWTQTTAGDWTRYAARRASA